MNQYIVKYKDIEKRKIYLRNYNRIWARKYRAKLKAEGKPRTWDRTATTRLKAINFLGGPVCMGCGCTDLRIIEINHVFGDGTKERKTKRNSIEIYRDIYLGRTPKENYNVLCKVCNAVHYIKLKFNINNYNIKWTMPI